MLALIIERSTDYWERLREWAVDNSDGCTRALDIHVDCCYEHDYHYQTGLTRSGVSLTKKQADVIFRRCLQSRSRFGVLSPMSWWRYFAVRRFGKGIWAQEESE